MKRHLITLTALKPVSHGDTQTGVDNGTNIRLFMRSGNTINGIPTRTPDISENSLRSNLFRAPLHEHLLGVLGIEKGTLPQSVVNLLFSGGNMKGGSKAPGDEIELGHTLKRLYPSLDLLGGAVDAFILPRSRLKLAAWPVAEEYARALEHISPEHAAQARLAGSVHDMLSTETRTRGTGDDSDGNQMLYEYETLNAGAQVLLEVTLDLHTPEATEAALRVALDNWPGYFGGQGRQGRGRMHAEHTLPDAQAYLDHLDAHADAMRQGLLKGTFGTSKVLCE